jgi:hypothetical protein
LSSIIFNIKIHRFYIVIVGFFDISISNLERVMTITEEKVGGKTEEAVYRAAALAHSLPIGLYARFARNREAFDPLKRKLKPNPISANRLRIQPSLKISSPEDKEEKEADSIAEKVMRMSVNRATNQDPKQKSCSRGTCGEAEKEDQTSEESESDEISAKLLRKEKLTDETPR